MNLLFWGLTLSVIGKGMLALGIIWVHITMANERRIDAEVIKAFRKETVITIIGFALIVIGYLMEIYFYGFTDMLTCSGAECAALLGGS